MIVRTSKKRLAKDSSIYRSIDKKKYKNNNKKIKKMINEV